MSWKDLKIDQQYSAKLNEHGTVIFQCLCRRECDKPETKVKICFDSPIKLEEDIYWIDNSGFLFMDTKMPITDESVSGACALGYFEYDSLKYHSPIPAQ